MKKTFLLGSSVVAAVLIAEAAKAMSFPMHITVTNKMPRDIALPSDGLFLRNCYAQSGCSGEALMTSADQLQRLASDIEQIATLNGVQEAVEISYEATGDEPVDVAPLAVADPAEDAANTGGDQLPTGGEQQEAAPATTELTADAGKSVTTTKKK